MMEFNELAAQINAINLAINAYVEHRNYSDDHDYNYEKLILELDKKRVELSNQIAKKFEIRVIQKREDDPFYLNIR